MSTFAPQFDLFKKINRVSSFGKFLFWAILIFSIFPVVCKEFCDKNNLNDYITILNIFGICLFFIIELIIEFYLLPKADNKRRDDFIDNSFGSNFSINNSNGYYDNDEINEGLYKASVNLFENCFFTFSLVKISTSSKTIIPTIMLLLIFVLAFYGFKQVPIALIVLQAFFSVNILGQYIKHFILEHKLSTILDTWLLLFQNPDLKTETHKYQAHIYKYWLQYETLISKINAGISDKTFTKNNVLLTDEWNKIKLKYNIN